MRRAAGAVAALVLAVLAALVPVPALAADAVPGGPANAPVPLPVADLDASFVASNVGRSNVRGDGAHWTNVAWYSWTPAHDVRVYLRATSLEPAGWDNTLEVWDGATLISQNDDSYDLDAALTVDLVAGRTYRIGLGAYSMRTGTATVQLATRVPSTPRELTATPGDGRVALTWQPPADVAGGVTSYVVQCAPAGQEPVVCATTTGTPPATSTTVTGLTNGTTYRFEVVARNVIGPSEVPVAVTAVPRAVSTTTLSVEPAAPVSGQPFDVIVRVDAAGAAPGTVDVTVGTDVRTGLPLVDGAVVVPGVVAPAGVLALAATYPGTVAVAPSGASFDVTVARRPHVLTVAPLPTDLVYAGRGAPVTAASSLGLPLTTTAAGACALAGTVLHPVDVGECTVTVTSAGDSESEPASATVTTQIGMRGQHVTAAPLPALVYGQEPVAVVATSDAALPVTVTAAGACRVEDGLLVVTDVGPCTVTATQAGDARTTAAAAVELHGDVVRRTQTVTITAFPAPTLGAPTPDVRATSSLGLPVTLTATGACTVVDGTLVAVSAGACTVTASAAGDERTLPAQASTTVRVSGPAAAVDVTTGGTLGAAAGGTQVSARGLGLRPGSELVLVVHSTPRTIGSAVVGVDGTAVVTGVLPTDLEAGAHRLVARGTAFDGSAVEHELGFAVAADGTFTRIGDSTVALAVTGASPGAVAALAASWLLVGAALVVVVRRRTAR